MKSEPNRSAVDETHHMITLHCGNQMPHKQVRHDLEGFWIIYQATLLDPLDLDRWVEIFETTVSNLLSTQPLQSLTKVTFPKQHARFSDIYRREWCRIGHILTRRVHKTNALFNNACSVSSVHWKGVSGKLMKNLLNNTRCFSF